MSVASSPSQAASPFWDFTLSIYRREGVSAACIALQDALGLDVNFLLFCLYAGNHGRALDRAELARLEAHVAPWRRNVIHPLRAVRRWLKEQDLAAKEAVDGLRRGVLTQEIGSEQQQQRLMEAAVAIPAGAPDAGAAALSLNRYLAEAQKVPGDAERASLAVLLVQGFGLAGPDGALALLDSARG